MPVQINEVIIKTVVDPSASKEGADASGGCGTSDSSGSGAGGAGGDADLAEKIFEIIRQKQER